MSERVKRLGKVSDQENRCTEHPQRVAANVILHPGTADSTESGGPMLTPGEAAKFLRLEPRTLESWRGRGIGPKFVRYSARCVRYRLKDLQDWIDTRVVTGVSA